MPVRHSGSFARNRVSTVAGAASAWRPKARTDFPFNPERDRIRGTSKPRSLGSNRGTVNACAASVQPRIGRACYGEIDAATGTCQAHFPCLTRQRMRFKRPAWALLLMTTAACLARPAVAEIRVEDDSGQQLSLPEPARRVISLAPHLTENLFAIGAGDTVIATVSFSDYPPAARQVPRIGSHAQVDLERIVALEPDLIVAWHSGNDRGQMAHLRALSLPVFASEPRNFDDIIANIEELGLLTGHTDQALQLAAQMRREVSSLAQQYRQREPVSVFYQVWNQPLMTVNDRHLIGHAIELCGGQNIFGDLKPLVPRVSIESVLAIDPAVIVSGGMGEDRDDWLATWRQWPSLQAVRQQQLVFIPPSLLQRHTPRVLRGTRRLCEALDAARDKRLSPTAGTGP